MKAQGLMWTAGAAVLLLGSFLIGDMQGTATQREAAAQLPPPTPVVVVHTRTVTRVRVATRTITRVVRVPVIHTRTVTKVVKVPVTMVVYRTRTLVKTVTVAAPATPTPVPAVDSAAATPDGVMATASDLRADHGGGYAPPSGQQYVVVHVVIRNNGDQAANYDALDFTLQSGTDNVRYHAGAFDRNMSHTALSAGLLAPGEMVAGDLVFQVPANDHRFGLLWTPDSFGTAIPVHIV